MKKYRLFALVAAISLLLDQLSKIYIDNNFEISQSQRVIANFSITYVRNPGAAFGILADSAIRLPFFIGISLIASLGILWYVRRVPGEKHWQHLSLGLILSGALGNLIDRIRYGEVIEISSTCTVPSSWPRLQYRRQRHLRRRRNHAGLFLARRAREKALESGSGR